MSHDLPKSDVAEHKPHVFDQAIALHATSDEGHYQGYIPAAYFNMVGPFGGVIASTLLNGVLSHPQHEGEPVSMTVNFAGPIADADFEVTATLIRQNRSSQHWTVQLAQEGAIAISALVLMAIRRETWEGSDLTMPAGLPSAESLPSFDTRQLPPWFHNYDFRYIEGGLELVAGMKAQENARTRLWIQDKPARPLDFLSLMALSDCFFPRVFLRRGQMMPAGTVSMTTYFHAGRDQLAEAGLQPLFAEARAQRYSRNYFDQVGELWSQSGELLATTQQIVYFKG
ncbi:thioesterase family protein [Aestuariicella sp. G3-2]|uniref:acyl-CoA thioesterase n=1 Tax=Pseudomaricurvus albidus TaxID=2842452 RepID=UPI001C0D9DE6|nr:thioesterase family protein [Aestuariicella albida]MBU3068801.1 thioesterase family protein [Aestuariicella albida]